MQRSVARLSHLLCREISIYVGDSLEAEKNRRIWLFFSETPTPRMFHPWLCVEWVTMKVFLLNMAQLICCFPWITSGALKYNFKGKSLARFSQTAQNTAEETMKNKIYSISRRKTTLHVGLSIYLQLIVSCDSDCESTLDFGRGMICSELFRSLITNDLG